MTPSLSLPNAPAAKVDPFAAMDAPPGRRPRLLGVLLIVTLTLVLAAGTGMAAWFAREPVTSAVLTAPEAAGGRPLFRVRLEPRRRHVLLTPVAGEGGRDRRHDQELWLVRTYGAPVSLGLIDPAHGTVLPVDPALLDAANPPTHLFVSKERRGGSRAAYPKGPTIAEASLPLR